MDEDSAANASNNAALPQTLRPNVAPSTTTGSNPPKVQQPKPQALPSRSGPSSILVSTRQKGNPILNNVRVVAWEYSDIPADYVLGATTCALFLSLKYHRLHPEYIYNRIRDLKGQYNLRILLTMVDIDNHEEALRELSKTSLINNVTIILCWSAQEAGRYLELFKTFEHVAPTSIRAQQSSSYSDKLVEFITVPRSINKTDAIGLVSNFGSVRTAVNAGPEDVGLIAGWGEKKVQRWCNTVREPFRIKKAARRGLGRDEVQATISREVSRTEAGEEPLDPTARLGFEEPTSLDDGITGSRSARTGEADADKRPPKRIAEEAAIDVDAEQAMLGVEGDMRNQQSVSNPSKIQKRKAGDEELSEGIMAALSKLRKQ